MITTEAGARLRRPRVPMPPFVEQALLEFGLMDAYQKRPPYQQNDYIGWIMRGAREVTRQKRLAQMLDELAAGNVYMNMTWRATGAPDGTAEGETRQ